MNKTKIETFDYTWNPITGCFHDCEYCYASKIVHRFSNKDYEKGKIMVLEKKPFNESYVNGFNPTYHKYRLPELKTLKKPSSIFVCSMADMFGDWIPQEWIKEILFECSINAKHNYIFLSKNSERISFEKSISVNDNLFFGTTITSQKDMDNLDSELDFLSIEPILTPIRFACNIGRTKQIIIGAETGNRKGKVIPQKEWIDNIVKQADEYGIRVFMKDSLKEIMGNDFRTDKLIWEIEKCNKH